MASGSAGGRPARSPQTKPTHPAATAPTYADVVSRQSPQKRGTRPPSGRTRAARAAGPVSHDTGLYKERNTVERLINKLKAWRGIATRYDKTPASYLAGLHLRAAMIWIKDLTRTSP
ncbi:MULTISPECIES: transposase [unclassified Microbispora]|uniref:transposase n=1 Tax=Microbispora sp. CSR-4 TaxID=2592813 RepID=UPI00143C5881|nr:transposase [Microbispora sp. CL1-1]